MILRPNFKEPLDTAKQLVEKDITIYFDFGFEDSIQWLLDSPILEYRILGENAIITDDTNHFNNITADDVMGAGTHAQMNYLISWYELELGEKHHPEGRGWYTSPNSSSRLVTKYVICACVPAPITSCAVMLSK